MLLSEMTRRWGDGDTDGAAVVAQLALPYQRSRVRPTKPAAEVAKLTDADLDQLCGADGASASDKGSP